MNIKDKIVKNCNISRLPWEEVTAPKGATAPSLGTTALKSCASAEAASCSAVGAEGGIKPQRIILLSNCSTIALSRARVNPHHAGEAYIKDETVWSFWQPPS